MSRIIHFAAALGAWGTLFVVVLSCVTGTTPHRWLAGISPSQLLIERQLRRASAANLKFLGEGLARYRARYGHEPTSFEDLVEHARVSKGIVESPPRRALRADRAADGRRSRRRLPRVAHPRRGRQRPVRRRADRVGRNPVAD